MCTGRCECCTCIRNSWKNDEVIKAQIKFQGKGREKLKEKEKWWEIVRSRERPEKKQQQQKPTSASIEAYMERIQNDRDFVQNVYFHRFC